MVKNKVIFTESMLKCKRFKIVKRKIMQSLPYFPELANYTIYIGIIDNSYKAYGLAMPCNNMLFLSESEEPKFVTIFHELSHIVIKKYKLPKTEIFCCIYGMARMPDKFVDMKIPKINVYRKYANRLCKKAIEYREKGNRDYVRYLRELLDHGY